MRIFWLVAAVAPALLLSGPAAGAIQYSWTAEVIDPDPWGGLNSSVSAVRLDDRWVAAYPAPTDSDWELRFARGDSGGWTYETIDLADGEIRHPSVALDADGRAHVAYGVEDELRFAARLGPQAWEVEPVTSVTKDVLFVSLVFDQTGTAAIGFTDGTLFGGGVAAYLAIHGDGGWTVRGIGDPDMAEPFGTSLAALPDGRLCVSYNDFADWTQRIAVAFWDGNAWSTETIADMPYRDPSATDAAISPDGHVCVAYWNAYKADGAVALATRAGPGLWDIESIDPMWYGFMVCPSIAFAPDGEPWVSYNSQSAARVAARVEGAWTVAGVFDGDAPATSTQIGFNRSGLPELIANGGETEGGVFRVVGAPTPWRLDVPDHAAPGHSYVVSVAYVPHLGPAMAYVDADAGEVRCAMRSGDEWSVTTVDGPGIEFEAPDIAAGPDGEIWISYRDHDHAQLRAARWNGSAWDITVVLDNHIGTSSRGAFDPGGTYHIAFWSRDESGFPIRLYYATWTGSEWSLDLAAPDIPCTGTDIGLVFDAREQPSIFWAHG